MGGWSRLVERQPRRWCAVRGLEEALGCGGRCCGEGHVHTTVTCVDEAAPRRAERREGMKRPDPRFSVKEFYRERKKLRRSGLLTEFASLGLSVFCLSFEFACHEVIVFSHKALFPFFVLLFLTLLIKMNSGARDAAQTGHKRQATV